MKEILQHGILKTYYIAKCQTCCCLFRFEKADIEEIIGRNESTSVVVICPECGTAITQNLPYITHSTNPDAPKISIENYKEELLRGIGYGRY